MVVVVVIGYGDLGLGPDFRWFEIFFLVVSTYFAGNALQGFATLRSQIDEIRRRAAWSRREVSKAMIDEMQGGTDDDAIDQFEFTVASLLQLGKIDADDVRMIMVKFRELCDGDGYIRIRSAGEKSVREWMDDESDRGKGKVVMKKLKTAMRRASLPLRRSADDKIKYPELELGNV